MDTRRTSEDINTPISVRVLAFARVRELLGRSEFVLSVPDSATVRDLWHTLVSQTPALAGFETTIRFACNSAIVTDSTRLRDRDEVALLPPVSGG